MISCLYIFKKYVAQLLKVCKRLISLDRSKVLALLMLFSAGLNTANISANTCAITNADASGWIYAGFLYQYFMRGLTDDERTCFLNDVENSGSYTVSLPENYPYNFMLSVPTSLYNMTTGIFNLAPKDVSYCMLQNLFGYMPGIFLAKNSPMCVNQPTFSTLMPLTKVVGGMFALFNWGMMAVLMVVVAYAIIQAVFTGAIAQGNILNQSLTFMAMLRICASAMMLIPNPTSGYTYLQTFVMYMILMGVGFADSAFHGALLALTQVSGQQSSSTLNNETKVQTTSTIFEDTFEYTRGTQTEGTQALAQRLLCSQYLFLLDKLKSGDLTLTSTDKKTGVVTIDTTLTSDMISIDDVIEEVSVKDYTDTSTGDTYSKRTVKFGKNHDGKWGKQCGSVSYYTKNNSAANNPDIYTDQYIYTDQFMEGFNSLIFNQLITAINYAVRYRTNIYPDAAEGNILHELQQCIEGTDVYSTAIMPPPQQIVPKPGKSSKTTYNCSLTDGLSPSEVAASNNIKKHTTPKYMCSKSKEQESALDGSGTDTQGDLYGPAMNFLIEDSYADISAIGTDVFNFIDDNTSSFNYGKWGTKSNSDIAQQYMFTMEKNTPDASTLLKDNARSSTYSETIKKYNLKKHKSDYYDITKGYNIASWNFTPEELWTEGYYTNNAYAATLAASDDNSSSDTQVQNDKTINASEAEMYKEINTDKGNSKGSYLDSVTYTLLDPLYNDYASIFSAKHIRGVIIKQTVPSLRNLRTSLMMIIEKLIGFKYFEKEVDENRYIKYQKLSSDDLVGSCGKSFKSFCTASNSAGCFENMQSKGCITGGGLLGSVATVVYGGTSYNPYADFADIGITILRSSAFYFVINNLELAAFFIGVNSIAMGYDFLMKAGSYALANGLKILEFSRSSILAATVVFDAGRSIFNTALELDLATYEFYSGVGSSFALIFLPLGALLAVLLPFYPFVIFATAAINWLFSVIEAMVAAPVIAIGVAHPAYHDFFGKSTQAVMIILSTLIRPILLIFGFFVSITTIHVMIILFNNGFIFYLQKLMAQITTTPTVVIVSYMGFMVVYLFTVWEVIAQCSNIMVSIPNNVTRWIGGTVDNMPGGNLMGAIKQQTQSAASGVQKGLKGSGDKFAGLGTLVAKQGRQLVKAVEKSDEYADESTLLKRGSDGKVSINKGKDSLFGEFKEIKEITKKHIEMRKDTHKAIKDLGDKVSYRDYWWFHERMYSKNRYTKEDLDTIKREYKLSRGLGKDWVGNKEKTVRELREAMEILAEDEGALSLNIQARINLLRMDGWDDKSITKIANLSGIDISKTNIKAEDQMVAIAAKVDPNLARQLEITKERMEQIIQERQEKLKDLLDKNPDAISKIDDKSEKIGVLASAGKTLDEIKQDYKVNFTVSDIIKYADNNFSVDQIYKMQERLDIAHPEKFGKVGFTEKFSTSIKYQNKFYLSRDDIRSKMIKHELDKDPNLLERAGGLKRLQDNLGLNNKDMNAIFEPGQSISESMSNAMVTQQNYRDRVMKKLEERDKKGWLRDKDGNKQMVYKKIDYPRDAYQGASEWLVTGAFGLGKQMYNESLRNEPGKNPNHPLKVIARTIATLGPVGAMLRAMDSHDRSNRKNWTKANKERRPTAPATGNIAKRVVTNTYRNMRWGIKTSDKIKARNKTWRYKDEDE